jgi:hypothetical protein
MVAGASLFSIERALERLKEDRKTRDKKELACVVRMLTITFAYGGNTHTRYRYNE